MKVKLAVQVFSQRVSSIMKKIPQIGNHTVPLSSNYCSSHCSGSNCENDRSEGPIPNLKRFLTEKSDAAKSLKVHQSALRPPPVETAPSLYYNQELNDARNLCLRWFYKPKNFKRNKKLSKFVLITR
ncbi:hypothetical protein QE152_g24957 [Popillia japonica]|uniref:Uncharacterized protein n=1 Tax=Popillia japonica TaxID=7064 RepID=A0AAW1K4N0_POPJA